MPTILRLSIAILYYAYAFVHSIPAQDRSISLPTPPAYPEMRFGITGGAHMNYHVANFIEFPGFPKLNKSYGYPDTISFRSTYSITPSIGLAFEAMVDPLFGCAVRLSYASHSGMFSAIEPIVLPTRDFQFTDAYFDHQLTVRLSSFAIEPTAIITPFPYAQGFKLYTGARCGFMLTHSFEQRTLLPPQYRNIAFPQYPTEHNVLADAIPHLSPIALSAIFGIAYELPIAIVQHHTYEHYLSLQSEVFGAWGLHPMVRDIDWVLHQVRAGISLLYRHEEIVQEYEERRHIDTVIVHQKHVRIPFMVGISTFQRDTVFTRNNGKHVRLITETLYRTDTVFTTPPPRMNTELHAVGLDEHGKEHQIVQLRVEEFIVQRYVPLLPYIFFEHQSSILPSRYSQLSPEQSALFDIDQFYQAGALDIYRSLLNIIGKRLRQYPNAILTLVGHNAGVGAEEGNIALSQARAEAVRKYLCDVWGIGSNRIIVKAAHLPEQASLPKTEQDKIEENRRVELYSTVREVLDPVLLIDTMHVSNPPTIRLRPSVYSEFPITDWSLIVFNEGRDIRRFSSTQRQDSMALDALVSGTETFPYLPTQIDWTPPRQGERSLKLSEAPLELSFTAYNAHGQSGFAHSSLPVQKVMLPDKKLEQFSLVLFGFNKAEISEQHQRMIAIMRSMITPNVKVTIAGYTDRTGNNAYNLTLSRQRALELARMLHQQPSKAQGFGEEVLLYDNTTPEGRFYCRTVNVSIETTTR
ncbi:MAG: OmpA family protein [Bacteroidota bacterium]|nr:OmpA family protein [Candidatus Kapabacteria bacterium]MDW8220733.1 OmpA family protein [Bacteroidota bacterium]